MNISIIKKLSRNDLGLTGSHQAGICVPKKVVAKDFFPSLNPQDYNPRIVIPMFCENERVDVNFIFYNNRLHGCGTRCEYRLTGISKFLKKHNLKEGESLVFTFDGKKQVYSLQIQYKKEERNVCFDEDAPIVIHAGWSLQYK